MSLVAVVGARSAGTTTSAVALAAAWPGGRAVVAECDPDGGCLALAAELPADPGLASLAVAARPGLTAGLLTGQLQRLGGGPPVLVGPPGPDQAAQAVAATAALLAQLAHADGWVCVADCGRLRRGSPAGQLLGAADAVVLVVEPTSEGVGHAKARLAAVPLNPDRTAVLVIGARPYSLGEVAAELGLAQLGMLPAHRQSADELREGRAGRRNPLIRAAGPTSAAIAEHLRMRSAA